MMTEVEKTRLGEYVILPNFAEFNTLLAFPCR